MKLKKVLFLAMAICLASGVKAQIYNSEVLFYISESANLTNPQTSIWIFRFKNGICQRVDKNDANRLKNVCDNLKSNINYYETHSSVWSNHSSVDTDHFDSKMSNAKWNVYSNTCQGYLDSYFSGQYIPTHTYYYAYKKDFSQYMYWAEPEYDDPMMGHVGERVTYKRLTKSELLKLIFTGARDFLQ